MPGPGEAVFSIRSIGKPTFSIKTLNFKQSQKMQIWVSTRFQVAIYTVFDVESDFAKESMQTPYGNWINQCFKHKET